MWRTLAHATFFFSAASLACTYSASPGYNFAGPSSGPYRCYQTYLSGCINPNSRPVLGTDFCEGVCPSYMASAGSTGHCGSVVGTALSQNEQLAFSFCDALPFCAAVMCSGSGCYMGYYSGLSFYNLADYRTTYVKQGCSVAGAAVCTSATASATASASATSSASSSPSITESAAGSATSSPSASSSVTSPASATPTPSASPLLPAGSLCTFDSACATSACRGGFCCAPTAARAGCAICVANTGTCLLNSPGDPCASNADCGTDLCAGDCCCASSALLSPGCTACACWTNASTTAATAGACVAGGGSDGGRGTTIIYNQYFAAGAQVVLNTCGEPAGRQRCHACEAFDASQQVDGLFILPSAHPLNPSPGVDLAVGLPGSCGTLAAAAAAEGVPPAEMAAMLPCLALPSFVIIDGVSYVVLGPAASLGLAALPEGCMAANQTRR